MAKRNYKREYKSYHARPKQIKRRAGRNKARNLMIKAGKAKRGDGKDVHHKDRNPKNSSRKNLRITSKKYNRSRNK